jgi:hypothetical protein
MTAEHLKGNQPVIVVNSAAVGAEVRSTAVPISDDHLRTDEGELVELTTTREEHRAAMLGVGAQHAVMDECITRGCTSGVAELLSEHDAIEAELAGGDVRRSVTEQLYAHVAQELLDVQSVPNNQVSRKRLITSLIAKGLFVAGDTAALGGIIYRSGQPLALSLVMGVSMAATVIGAGTQAGHEVALHHQRRERGRPPAGCPAGVLDLFDDGSAAERYRWWLTAGLVAGCGLFVALTLLGVGLGDPAAVAMGWGLLAALTFAGSAAIEGYATNAAAERLRVIEGRLAALECRLVPFEVREHRAARALSLARSLNIAARHRALAAGVTVSVVADRTPDNPHVWGYADYGAFPLPAGVELRGQELVPDANSEPETQRRRREPVVLARPFVAGAPGDETRIRSVS